MNNMFKEFKNEILVTLLLMVFAGIFLNPYCMTEGSVFCILASFIVLFGLFVGLIWKERGGDEREVYLRNIGGRSAYIGGVIILTIGIVFEIYKTMEVDHWLVGAFVGMVLIKIVSLIYIKLVH